jgi:hypothetical protein
MLMFLAMVSSQVEKRLLAGSNVLSRAKAARNTSWARSSQSLASPVTFRIMPTTGPA